jgi:hypothetical protein
VGTVTKATRTNCSWPITRHHLISMGPPVCSVMYSCVSCIHLTAFSYNLINNPIWSYVYCKPGLSPDDEMHITLQSLYLSLNTTFTCVVSHPVNTESACSPPGKDRHLYRVTRAYISGARYRTEHQTFESSYQLFKFLFHSHFMSFHISSRKRMTKRSWNQSLRVSRSHFVPQWIQEISENSLIPI